MNKKTVTVFTKAIKGLLLLMLNFIFTWQLSQADENDFRMTLGKYMLSHYVVSPRAAGLGGTYAAINEGAHGTYMNPATLGAQSGHEIINTMSVERFSEGSKRGTYMTVTVGGSFNLPAWKPDYYQVEQHGNQSLGVRFTHIKGWASGYDGFNQGTTVGNIAYGRSFNQGRVLAGISVGVLSTRINDTNLLDLDILNYEVRAGTILRITRAFSLGGVVAFGFGEYEDNQVGRTVQGNATHREFRLGASLQLTDSWMVTSDIVSKKFERAQLNKSPREVEEHNILRFSVGSEVVVIPQKLTTRAGFFVYNDEFDVTEIANVNDSQDNYIGLSGGWSYYHDNWSLGTDHELKGNGDHGHYVNFLLNF